MTGPRRAAVHPDERLGMIAADEAPVITAQERAGR